MQTRRPFSKKVNHSGGVFKSLLIFALASFMALAFYGCPGDDVSEEEAIRLAKKQIQDSLILPPDSTLLKDEVKAEVDGYYMRFSSNDEASDLAQYFKNEIQKNKFKIATTTKGDVGISYRDNEKRLVTIHWSQRDVDLFGYKTIIHVLVQPLPEILEKTAAGSKEE